MEKKSDQDQIWPKCSDEVESSGNTYTYNKVH